MLDCVVGAWAHVKIKAKYIFRAIFCPGAMVCVYELN